MLLITPFNNTAAHIRCPWPQHALIFTLNWFKSPYIFRIGTLLKRPLFKVYTSLYSAYSYHGISYNCYLPEPVPAPSKPAAGPRRGSWGVLSAQTTQPGNKNVQQLHKLLVSQDPVFNQPNNHQHYFFTLLNRLSIQTQICPAKAWCRCAAFAVLGTFFFRYYKHNYKRGRGHHST